MDQRYAAEFVDVESVSENEQVLLSETPARSRRTSFSKAALFSAVLIGFVCAGVFAVSMRRESSKTRTSQVIGFSSVDDFSSLLSDDAAKSVSAAMDELGPTTEEATTTEGATEKPTEEPTTEAPEAATAETTKKPTLSFDDALEAVGSATVEATTTVVATEAPSSEISESSTVAATEAPAALTAASTTVAAATAVATATETTAAGASSSHLQSIALQLQQQASGLDKNSADYKKLMSISKMLTTPPKGAAPSLPTALGSATTVPALGSANTATTPNPAESALAPQESIGDGNPCPDDEESNGGLCFKKCSDLTGGTHPIRSSSFSCCAAKPCGFSNTVTNMGMCWGFDVAADSQQSKCPHSPGACLVNEEEFNGMCYKKCSDLTTGQFQHRVAAATCCKKTGWECLLFSNLKTDAQFAQGGGAGDGNSGTPAEGHPPIAALTR